MRNPAFAFGIILAILGVLALGWQGISYTTHETLVDAGPIKINVEKQRDVPIWPIVGAVALIGGIGMIAMNRKSIA